MKILIWKSKHFDYHINYDNPDKAFRYVFDELNTTGYYNHLEDYDKKLYDAIVQTNDPKYIKLLLQSRNGYEYESWDIEEVIEP